MDIEAQGCLYKAKRCTVREVPKVLLCMLLELVRLSETKNGSKTRVNARDSHSHPCVVNLPESWLPSFPSPP